MKLNCTGSTVIYDTSGILLLLVALPYIKSLLDMKGGSPFWQWCSVTRTGLPRVREKSGKNKIFSRSGNCQGILKKCQGILAI